MNRIDRLSAILIQLQSKKVVKAQDIAGRFRISLRTVYRDVHALSQGGVPVIGEAGIGYSIMDGYRLPPVMFTTPEATALVTAEKLVEQLTDPKMAENYRSALFKIKAVLRGYEKEQLDILDENIGSLPNPWLPPKTQDNNLQDILRSITNKTVLQLRYRAAYADEATFRTVEPVGIFHQYSQWYLIAWCHLRKDYRNFRVSRILEMKHGQEPYEKQHPTLQQYLQQVKREKELHKVVLRITKAAAKYLGEQKYYSGYVSEKDLGDEVEMTFLTSSPEGFARWYLMMGDRAHIVSPAHLKTRVKKILDMIAERV